MRTRSQGHTTDEDRSSGDDEPEVLRDRDVDAPKQKKKKDGRFLTVDVNGTSTRTSFEAPISNMTLESRKVHSPSHSDTLDDEKDKLRTGIAGTANSSAMPSTTVPRLKSSQNPWSCSPLTIVVTMLAALAALTIFHSFTTRQLDPKGCAMSYMRSAYAPFPDFDTEHTRLAKKYSLYLYREEGVDEESTVWNYAYGRRTI